MEALVFSQDTGQGVEIARALGGTPDGNGVLRTWEVRLPDFRVGCYYAAFQAYDCINPECDNWPNGANRVQPLPVSDCSTLKKGGLFFLLHLENDRTLALLPLSTSRVVSWFESADGTPVLRCGTLGTGELAERDEPVCAWACSDDPYEACQRAWLQAAQAVEESTRLRVEKHLPRLFEYLGWCSWEEYKANISEELLLDAVEKIRHSGLPIRYVLVDDGHLDADDKRRLLSFETNDKFPNGWAPIRNACRDAGIPWTGLWLNFNGYWHGISPEHRLASLKDSFMEIGSGALQPGLDRLDAIRFYDAMIENARRAGFDFVKVDNQAANLALYRGTEQPVQCAAQNARALEQACAVHVDGLINCMAHGTVPVFNTRVSTVTRCSEDYQVGSLERARRHLHNSYGNIPWLGQTAWGDHDMFHSNDDVSGRMMAVSKAMSGGPVYLSDAPDAFDAEVIDPLCFSDGRLLRPAAPAAPTPESLYVDPFRGGQAYRAIAPLNNRSAALVVYNLTEPEEEVEAVVVPEDYTWAGAMIQPGPERWAIPEEGLVLYDWYQGKGARLTDPVGFALPSFADRLFLLCPITRNWAVIGRTDKFLSPVAADVVFAGPNELVVRLEETGPLTLWNGSGTLSTDAGELEDVGEGLVTLDLPVSAEPSVIIVRRTT